MALVKCTECGKEISDKAASCPGCGAPIGVPIVAATKEKKKTSKITWAVLILILVGIVYSYKESSLPSLPVEVSTRPALIGRGLVLHVNNTSDESLMVVATLENPTTKEEKSFRLDIRPHGFSEIGHSEGWVVANGDKVKLFNKNFKTGNWEI